MELLVVGLGSMGKRRARLIRGVEPSAALAGVDFAPARREEARALGIEPYESIAAAVAARHFDAAFVCTAPLTHAGIIGELLDAGLPVFTELNLVDDGYDALIAKAAQKGLPLFLSSTMLYRTETRLQSPSITSTTSGSICRTGTHGKIIKTFLWATGARGACGRSSASICPGCWTLSVR